MLFPLIIFFAAAGMFYTIVSSNLPGLWKFILSVLEMGLVSQLFILLFNIPSEMGMLLIKTRKGLSIVENIAKRKEYWQSFTDVGFVLSYGMLAPAFIKIRPRNIILGLLILAVLSTFVTPFILPFMVTILGIDSGTTLKVVEGNSITTIIALAILLIGGFFLTILYGLFSYAIRILLSIFRMLVEGGAMTTAPGATVLIPGINLPLIEGILALLVILIVHEGAHAILARIASVPLRSAGVVLFGILPIGAFVEPDEEMLKKTERVKQSRVLVAGATANLLTSLFVFFIFILLLISTTSLQERGLYVVKGMEKGTIIYGINGTSITTLNLSNMNLPPNTEILLNTNKGNITRTTTAAGRLGIVYINLNSTSGFTVFKYDWLNFLYTLFGLLFSLNFIIGVVNLLPIPLFDGYRLIELNIKNKQVVTILSGLALVAFLLNFLPLLF